MKTDSGYCKDGLLLISNGLPHIQNRFLVLIQNRFLVHNQATLVLDAVPQRRVRLTEFNQR